MRLYIVRRAQRGAFYLPMGGTRENPSLMFFLPQPKGKQLGAGHLDELVRCQLARQGISKEADVNALVNKAEAEYEERIKMAEAHQEAKRLMALRAAGAKLMQFGYRKWKQVFYPATKRLEKGGE